MLASVPYAVRGAILVAVVAFLLIFFLPDRKIESPLQSNGTTYGRILVDSPEIYTRERMVNDRFRQEAWLLEQLDRLTDAELGIQGQTAGNRSSSRDANFSSGANNVQADASDPVAGEVKGQPEPATRQPQLTPIESFRGHQAVREEIRNALIENQLDDRHDLGGNTLYRLKFDATVIPGNDTSAWAQINVRLSRKTYSEAQEEQELKELYKRWMSDLREQVNTDYSDAVSKATMDETTNSRLYEIMLARYGIYAGYSANRNDWAGKPYLENEQCREILLRLDPGESGDSENRESETLTMQGYSPERFKCLLDAAPRILGCEEGTCWQQLVREDLMPKVINAYGTTLGERAGTRKELKKQGRSTGSSSSSAALYPGAQPDSSRQYVSFLSAPDLDSILVEEYSPKIYVVPHELIDAEREIYKARNNGDRIYAIAKQLSDDERQLYHESKNKLASDAEIIQDWRAELNCDEFVRVNLADREFDICKSNLDKLQPFSRHGAGAGDAPVFDVNIVLDWDGLPYFIGAVDDRKILEAWNNVMACPKTASIYVHGREFNICDSWIEEFRDLNLAKVMESGALSIDAQVENDFDGLPFIVVNVGYSQFRQKLKTSERNKFIFSYAVTPRESSQQLASSSSLSVAEQIRARVSGGTGGAEVVAGAGRSNLVSEYAQILERRPVIVGIASHQSNKPLGSDDDKSAELGWLIGPKLVIGPDGLATYRHLPSQNSLSALVSAPSWWRRADIEIETGWLDNNGVIIGEPVKVSYPIALPGDQDEITSALLRGGIRPKPSVEKVEPMRVEIGKEARLLIEGQNLWRSTVVTIGAQRSKKIFVLPNMQGIIAEFDPIKIQETRASDAGSATSVRVWTSEGVALWKDGINVIAPKEQ